jgi:prepilin-type N-terminal cleavage/methylation domain-containing protein
MTKKTKPAFTLIELLVVIGILAVLLAIVLVAINPSKQFKQANDTKRTSDVNAILNAITQYGADNKGDISALAIPAPTALPAAQLINKTNFLALCNAVVPTYIAALPADPTTSVGVVPITDCNQVTDWSTGYSVTQATDAGRVTVTAVSETNPAVPISVTR